MKTVLGRSLLIATLPFLVVPAARANDGADRFRARLVGLKEVPSISTVAQGDFLAGLSEDGLTLFFRLRYSGLEGDVAVSHIHFGQEGANGGVSTFLCGGGGKPACPASPATVTGTITPADILGPAGQGIAAGEFQELVRALRRGNTYANVHSSKFPGGEIRGQILVLHDDH